MWHIVFQRPPNFLLMEIRSLCFYTSRPCDLPPQIGFFVQHLASERSPSMPPTLSFVLLRGAQAGTQAPGFVGCPAVDIVLVTAWVLLDSPRPPSGQMGWTPASLPSQPGNRGQESGVTNTKGTFLLGGRKWPNAL